ncbi:MAG: hypothetical protein V8Q36_08410 [Anaerotignum sp.]
MMDQAKTEANAATVLDTRMSGTAKIEAEVEEPKITAEANSHVTDLIGSFKTTYTMSDKNRNTNLEVGCNYINGTVLAPGKHSPPMWNWALRPMKAVTKMLPYTTTAKWKKTLPAVYVR